MISKANMTQMTAGGSLFRKNMHLILQINILLIDRKYIQSKRQCTSQKKKNGLQWWREEELKSGRAWSPVVLHRRRQTLFEVVRSHVILVAVALHKYAVRQRKLGHGVGLHINSRPLIWSAHDCCTENVNTIKHDMLTIQWVWLAILRAAESRKCSIKPPLYIPRAYYFHVFIFLLLFVLFSEKLITVIGCVEKNGKEGMRLNMLRKNQIRTYKQMIIYTCGNRERLSMATKMSLCAVYRCWVKGHRLAVIYQKSVATCCPQNMNMINECKNQEFLSTDNRRNRYSLFAFISIENVLLAVVDYE